MRVRVRGEQRHALHFVAATGDGRCWRLWGAMPPTRSRGRHGRTARGSSSSSSSKGRGPWWVEQREQPTCCKLVGRDGSYWHQVTAREECGPGSLTARRYHAPRHPRFPRVDRGRRGAWIASAGRAEGRAGSHCPVGGGGRMRGVATAKASAPRRWLSTGERGSSQRGTRWPTRALSTAHLMAADGCAGWRRVRPAASRRSAASGRSSPPAHVPSAMPPAARLRVPHAQWAGLQPAGRATPVRRRRRTR
jgi:hypothetical protein